MSFALYHKRVNTLNEHKPQRVTVFDILTSTRQYRPEDYIPEATIHLFTHSKSLFKKKVY